MVKIYHVSDPYKPLNDLEASRVDGGVLLWDYLLQKYPGFMEFSSPTICLVDGDPWLREDWRTKPLPDGATVIFTPAVGSSVIIAIVVAIIVAVAVVLFMDFSIPLNNGLPEPDPVYSVKGQSNQNRKGEPIEKHYGSVRHWPSLASRPYNQFDGDDQYLYLLLCVGLDEYYVDDLLADDTNVEELNDVVWEKYNPGQPVTLFPTFVETAAEVAGLDLVGPNEEGYEWSGWYIITAAGEKTYRIELDLSFRQGAYKTNKKGGIDSRTVEAEFQYQEVDDFGAPVGSILTLLDFSQTLKTVNQKRTTFPVTVDPARYQVRGRRTTNHNFADEAKIRDTLTWEAVRAFNKTVQNFGNVTLIAIKAKASRNLNDQTRNRWNVRIRSVAPIWNSGTGVWAKGITRSPVWAMLDILRADYGRNLPDKHLNLPELAELASDIQEDAVYFDWTFDQRGTIWPAIQVALNVARARPVIPNAVISAVRDIPMTVPTVGFNLHNIKKGSFKLSTKLPVFGDNDGIEVEYVNSVSWERETVVCLLDEDNGINPKQIRLSGCTDRNAAYRWGLAARAMERDQVHNIQITTGIEGGNVVFGDLAVIQHDLLPLPYDNSQEQSGRLRHGALEIFFGGPTIVTLPKAPIFKEDSAHRISIRDRTGIIRGPFPCTAHENPFKVVIDGALDYDAFEVSEFAEPGTYFFGPTGQEMLYCKVTKVEPSDKENVQITLVPYTERAYSFYDAVAPAMDIAPTVPPTPKNPIVIALSAHYVPDNLFAVLLEWKPAAGADYYVIETSEDGVSWVFESNASFASYRLTVSPGHLYVRVAGVGEGIGPWATWDGEVGVPTTVPEAITGLMLDQEFDSDTLYVSWDQSFLAVTYMVKIFLGVSLLDTIEVENPELIYDAVRAKAAATTAGLELSRALTIQVAGKNLIGTGAYTAPLIATNPAPAVLISPEGIKTTEDGDDVYVYMNWDQTLDRDAESYYLYAGYVPGFPIDGTTQRYRGSANSFTFRASSAETTLYWKVGAKDRWGFDINLTPEQSVAL